MTQLVVSEIIFHVFRHVGCRHVSWGSSCFLKPRIEHCTFDTEGCSSLRLQKTEPTVQQRNSAIVTLEDFKIKKAHGSVPKTMMEHTQNTTNSETLTAQWTRLENPSFKKHWPSLIESAGLFEIMNL